MSSSSKARKTKNRDRNTENVSQLLCNHHKQTNNKDHRRLRISRDEMSSATVVEHAASKKSGDAGAAAAAATATAADAATSPPPPDCSLLTHLNHVCRAIIVSLMQKKKIPAQKQVSGKTAGSMDQSHRFKKKEHRLQRTRGPTEARTR
jgi:hypothetical protein